jgi:hypothetical protein
VKPALAEASGALASFPLALASIIGLAAVFLLVARLTHFWAGVGAVLVAATAPTFYVHGAGSIAESAAWAPTAAAVTGLALAALGHGPRRVRRCALALGVVALGFGYQSSGALVGVLLPAASVALSWAIAERPSEGRSAAWLACAACGAALALEAHAAFTSLPDAPHGALAAMTRSARRSFDFSLARLGRDFFPWSALLPASLAAMGELPVSSLRAEAATFERQSGLRVLLLTGTALSYAASALPTVRPQPFAGLIFVAGAVALWLWDVGLGARVSRSALAASALFVTLVGIDFVRLPQVHAQTFAPGPPLPAQLGTPSGPNGPAAAAFVAAVLLTWAGIAAAFWDSRRTRQRCARLARRLGLSRSVGGDGIPGVLLFAGALLAALVIRWAHEPAPPALRPSTVAEGG